MPRSDSGGQWRNPRATSTIRTHPGAGDVRRVYGERDLEGRPRMAINYTLGIDTPWSADTVAAEVLGLGRTAGILSGSDTVDGLLAGAGTRLGTWVRVTRRTESAEPWASWDPVAGTFGLTATVWVSFRLGKNDDLASQDDDLIRMVSGLLVRVPGDHILWMSESDCVWLLRRDGELSLSERDGLWPPHRLAMITQPYRRATVAFDDAG